MSKREPLTPPATVAGAWFRRQLVRRGQAKTPVCSLIWMQRQEARTMLECSCKSPHCVACRQQGDEGTRSDLVALSGHISSCTARINKQDLRCLLSKRTLRICLELDLALAMYQASAHPSLTAVHVLALVLSPSSSHASQPSSYRTCSVTVRPQ